MSAVVLQSYNRFLGMENQENHGNMLILSPQKLEKLLL